MKSFRSMFKGYAVALLAVAFFTASAHATANRGIIRAVRDGSAQVSTDKGKNWKPAAVGMTIAQNSVIKTDASARVDVFLGDNGPVVRVNPNSQLGFDKLDVDNTGTEKIIETQLDLKSGQILGNVKKMAAASKYEVKTPHGVAGIRGTEYSISADGTVNVVSGTVVVVYIVDNVPQPPVTIQANQQVVIPTATGVTPQVTSVSQEVVGAVPTLTVGVTTNPGGTMTVNLDKNGSDGKPIVVTTSSNGTLPVPPPGTVLTYTPGPNDQTQITQKPVTTVTPNPSTTTTGNFDTTNGALSEDKPGSN